jgi:hypothetical protein
MRDSLFAHGLGRFLRRHALVATALLLTPVTADACTIYRNFASGILRSDCPRYSCRGCAIEHARGWYWKCTCPDGRK